MSTSKSKGALRHSQVSLLTFVSPLEARVDSRIISEKLGISHKKTFWLIKKYETDLLEFGQLYLRSSVGKRQQGGGNPEKYFLLNESQSYLLLTYSKNTEKARDLKKGLVKDYARLRKQENLRANREWKEKRASTALTYRLMSDVLKDARENIGKETKAHHYMNEAKLVNWALTGDFCSVNREMLSAQDLELLERLEYQNTILINRGHDRGARKAFLLSYAEAWRFEHDVKQIKEQPGVYLQ